MTAYYNEIDPYAAQWLRNLISAGHIAHGDVDERSIADVQPDDIAAYDQCHFFAGIGGWSYALRLAGWPDDRPVCPCQPLSSAGQHKGHADERHLWPAFFSLIAERAPSIVFGEQVANADGREWLSSVRVDLETVGYAIGCADLCAAGVGAPHPRQRLFWMADAQGSRRRWRESLAPWPCQEAGGSGAAVRNEPWPDGRGSQSTLAVSDVLSPSYGIPNRVAQLHAIGNAIVPQVAAQFIEAAMTHTSPERPPNG